MKKVLITLGFAAATIMAANAQEVPAAEEQPQTTVQTQPNTQDETLDADTQPMDDRAVNDTYNNEVTEPETETVRDEQINDMPTEPMQDDSMDETPLQEEPMEDTDALDQPNTTTTPSDVNNQSNTDEPIDEMQEDVVEMQGENPNAQSSMQDIPSKDADDQSYSSTRDNSEIDTETNVNPANQQTEEAPNSDYDNNSSALNKVDQDSQDAENPVKTISESELPEEVTKAFKDGEYAKASIEKVYMLEDEAVDKLMQNNAEQMYIGEQNPDKIYQLQVKGDEGQNILYYNESGDLLGSASI